MSIKRERLTEYNGRVIRIETVRSCPIIVGVDLMDKLQECFDFSDYSSIVLMSDARVKELYGQFVKRALQVTGKGISVFTLPVGERSKSLRMAERGYRFLLDNNVDRKGLICTLGGVLSATWAVILQRPIFAGLTISSCQQRF